MRQVVILRVIVGHIVDVGETQSGQPGLLEEREIGIVGQQLISFVAERRSDRMGRGGGEFADQLAVSLAGFEHHGRTAGAARFEVHHQADLFHQRMMLQKALGAQQPAFFAVGEQEDHVVAQARAGQQGAQRFELQGHGMAVIADAGAGGDRIVMPGEHHRLAAGNAGQSRHNVVHRGGAVRGTPARVDHDSGLHLRLHAQGGELLHDIVAHRVVRRAADRMRHTRESPQMDEGARGREVRRRSGGGDYWRRANLEHAPSGSGRQEDEGQSPNPACGETTG